jgi:hypothetical protein
MLNRFGTLEEELAATDRVYISAHTTEPTRTDRSIHYSGRSGLTKKVLDFQQRKSLKV